MAVNHSTLIKRLEALEATRYQQDQQSRLSCEIDQIVMAIQLTEWGLETLPPNTHFSYRDSEPPHYGMPELVPIDPTKEKEQL